MKWDSKGTVIIMPTIEKRVKKDGSLSFRAKVCVAGYPQVTATFSKQRDAKSWAMRIESDMRERRLGGYINANKYTVADAIDRYVKDILPFKSDSQRYLQIQCQQLKWWKSRVGSYRLNRVTSDVLSQQRDHLKRRLSNATVNLYLIALGSVLNKATKEWKWIADNPVNDVEKMKLPSGRTRYLSDKERDALLKACKESSCDLLYLIVVLTISTGIRKSEMQHLRWEDFDYTRQQIVLQKTKNREKRSIALRGLSFKQIEKYWKELGCPLSGWVFPSRNRRQPINIDYAWRGTVRRAGLKDFHFHDLRHTAASYLAMSGASLAVLSEFLGHKTLNMVKRYSHLCDAHMGEQVDKMNKSVFG